MEAWDTWVAQSIKHGSEELKLTSHEKQMLVRMQRKGNTPYTVGGKAGHPGKQYGGSSRS